MRPEVLEQRMDMPAGWTDVGLSDAERRGLIGSSLCSSIPEAIGRAYLHATCFKAASETEKSTR
jgi:hypothetical protein